MANFLTSTSFQVLMIGTTFDTATTSLLDKLMVHAENEVFKYLSKRYDVSGWTSTANTPPLVISLGETICEGYMQQRMSRGGKEALARGKDLVKQAQDNLKMIADYKADLLSSSGAVVSDFSNTSYRVLSNTSDYTPTFGEDDELAWKVDQDKLDDLESERD